MEESAILGSKKHSEEEEEMSRQHGRRGMGRLTLQDSVENSFREKLVVQVKSTKQQWWEGGGGGRLTLQDSVENSFREKLVI